MANITMSEVKDIQDEKLKGIATRVLNIMKISAERAYAAKAPSTQFKMPGDKSSAEYLFANHLSRMPADQQMKIANKAFKMAVLPESERVKSYGDLAKANLQMTDSVSALVGKMAFPANLRMPVSYLAAMRGNLHTSVIRTAPQVFVQPPTWFPGRFLVQQMTDELELRLLRIRCEDETDGWGSDEIAMGGMAVGPSGNTINIPEQFIGKFDTGTVMGFSPPKQFFSPAINLRDGGDQWPKEYVVTMAMAEKDGSGFSRFLTELWAKVKDEVLRVVAAAVGAAAGTALGSIIPGIGTVVGAIVGAVLGWLVGWLMSSFEDDLFEPVTLSISIPSLAHLWDGRPNSPEREARLVGKDGDGIYRVTYDWRRTFATPPIPARRLTGMVNMYALDHETVGRNEQGTAQRQVDLQVKDLGRDVSIPIAPLGVGGEVRLEVNIKATLSDILGNVRVYGEVQLYEGDSENTRDLDGVRPVDIYIPAGSTKNVTINIYNDDEGGDLGEVKIQLTNRAV